MAWAVRPEGNGVEEREGDPDEATDSEGQRWGHRDGGTDTPVAAREEA